MPQADPLPQGPGKVAVSQVKGGADFQESASSAAFGAGSFTLAEITCRDTGSPSPVRAIALPTNMAMRKHTVQAGHNSCDNGQSGHLLGSFCARR